MSSRLGLGRMARLTRRQLILFALISAAINGIVTASVGAWLAQTYNAYQSRRNSIQNLSDLIYERRTRGGMLVSSLRRGADLDEVRFRKRAYDEVFVEWNKKIQQNVFQIRQVVGARAATETEKEFQDLLVSPLAHIDTCITKAYDLKMAGQDPLPVLAACDFPVLHQLVLDCASAMTDAFYQRTQLSFMPSLSGQQAIATAEEWKKVRTACTRPEQP